jgi:Restriction endonuclease
MYDLHSLGWHSFQQLCLTIAREILGRTVESFLDSNDGGRDGAFTGIWSPHGHESFRGRFVIQCKFTSKRDYNLRASDLSDELAKAKRLVDDGRCDCYILLTNAGLSGREAEKIENLYKRAGAKQVCCMVRSGCASRFRRANASGCWVNHGVRHNTHYNLLTPRSRPPILRSFCSYYS